MLHTDVRLPALWGRRATFYSSSLESLVNRPSYSEEFDPLAIGKRREGEQPGDQKVRPVTSKLINHWHG